MTIVLIQGKMQRLYVGNIISYVWTPTIDGVPEMTPVLIEECEIESLTADSINNQPIAFMKNIQLLKEYDVDVVDEVECMECSAILPSYQINYKNGNCLDCGWGGDVVEMPDEEEVDEEEVLLKQKAEIEKKIKAIQKKKQRTEKQKKWYNERTNIIKGVAQQQVEKVKAYIQRENLDSELVCNCLGMTDYKAKLDGLLQDEDDEDEENDNWLFTTPVYKRQKELYLKADEKDIRQFFGTANQGSRKSLKNYLNNAEFIELKVKGGNTYRGYYNKMSDSICDVVDELPVATSFYPSLNQFASSKYKLHNKTNVGNAWAICKVVRAGKLVSLKDLPLLK